MAARTTFVARMPARCEAVDALAAAQVRGQGSSEQDADAGSPRCVVIDTNCVLDLWLFADPRVADLRRAVLAGTARWLATPAMRAELQRVLGYPAIVRQCALRDVAASDVLAAFDRWTHGVPAAAAARMRCGDPDDQVFIDLAAAWHADLYSRDHEVRMLAPRLGTCGVRVRPRLQRSGGACRREEGAY